MIPSPVSEKELINSPICVLAIDPGQSGAVFKIGRGKFDGRRDFKNLRDIAHAVRDLSLGVDCAVIEGVAARPGQGVTSMFSFGRSTGTAFGALCVCLPEACPIFEVWPQRWQGFFRSLLGMAKTDPFESRIVSARMFPEHAPCWTLRKLDHGSGDSILLASYILLQHDGLASLDSFLSPKVADLKNGNKASVARGRRGRKKRKDECGQQPNKSHNSSTSCQEQTGPPNTPLGILPSTPES